MLNFDTIVHPTDFSDDSMEAFVHALRLALAARAKLYILHVHTPHEKRAWLGFPHVRSVLGAWGLLDEHDPQAAVAEHLGVRIAKIEIGARDPVTEIVNFCSDQAASLLVMSTHGRNGIRRWISGSVAEAAARRAAVPALFVTSGVEGFVSQSDGAVHLPHVLVPVDHDPSPATALNSLMQFLQHLQAADPAISVVHVGAEAPHLVRTRHENETVHVERFAGPVVETICELARERGARLIVMPTRGRDGVLDALRGSTTERVVRQAPCPVLALPVE